MAFDVGLTLTEAIVTGRTLLLGNCVQTKDPPRVDGTAVKVPELPEQIVIELTVTVGLATWLIVIDSVSVHPFAAVAVTAYVPAEVKFTVELEPNPLLHW